MSIIESTDGLQLFPFAKFRAVPKRNKVSLMEFPLPLPLSPVAAGLLMSSWLGALRLPQFGVNVNYINQEARNLLNFQIEVRLWIGFAGTKVILQNRFRSITFYLVCKKSPLNLSKIINLNYQLQTNQQNHHNYCN